MKSITDRVRALCWRRSTEPKCDDDTSFAVPQTVVACMLGCTSHAINGAVFELERDHVIKRVKQRGNGKPARYVWTGGAAV